ncbi:acyltransferase [Curvibacter sp. RS43]|uniref:acyltransferase family protein n=1 Tax=Curvibacter microcysteis TaxID=3026419 RepID=UPI00235EAF12|nr:acyltransferase [Curvibacter sp. RS43]MDD0810268.1 acyltransferase [Curvibacter sp. RS43]
MPPSPSTPSAYWRILIGLLVVYGAWLLAMWPGALGEDSLAILLEVQTAGEFQAGKPAFWFYFVNTLYASTGRVEAPIAFQLLLTALVFARVLAWCRQQGQRWVFWGLLVLVCLAPHMVFHAGLLYTDGPFSVAAAGLLFELWCACRAGRLSRSGLAMVALTLPFAVLARSNGIVFLLSLVVAVWCLRGRSRQALVALGLACVALGGVTEWMHKGRSHGVMFPLALYETINFMQPRPMGLSPLESRVSAETLKVLDRYAPREQLLAFYDRDYWDPLVYRAGGPDLFRVSTEDRATLVNEFFRYNLWHNLPAFMSSRVNLFLVSALAQGGMGSPLYSESVLKRIKSQSEYRPFGLDGLSAFFDRLYQHSLDWRALLWSPLVGILLVGWMCLQGWRERRVLWLMVAGPYALQIAAIFLFSIAGEYRYWLPLFVFPLVAWPMLREAQTARLAQAVPATPPAPSPVPAPVAPRAPAAPPPPPPAQAGPDRPQAPAAEHFAAIDSLRALAAGLVFFYHFYALSPGPTLELFQYLPVVAMGWIGVDLFLLISGFVITRSGLSQQTLSTPSARRHFIVRRLARIVPLYLLTSVVWLVGVDDSALQQGAAMTTWQVFSHLTFLHNLLPNSHGSINGPTWSIALEMQFYVLVLLTLRYAYRLRVWQLLVVLLGTAWAFKGLVALVLAQAQNADQLKVIYTGELPGTLDEFGIGICLALGLYRQWPLLKKLTAPGWRNTLMWLALFALAFNACAQVMASHADYWHHIGMVVFWKTGLVAAFGCLLLAALSLPKPANTLLKPLNYLGQVSYGIYLWHMPVLKVWLQAGQLQGYPLLAAVLLCTLVLAILSWHLIEQPLLKRIPQWAWVQRWCQAGQPVADALARSPGRVDTAPAPVPAAAPSGASAWLAGRFKPGATGEATSHPLRSPWLALALVVFWVGVLRQVDLPGIYMDGVNPDYLAVRVLNPELNNPAWVLPFWGIPFLGGLYHGLQNAYVGVPVFWLMGSTVIALRVAQALFGAAIVVGLFAVTERATRSRVLAGLAAVALAADVAFLASFRTQNYIILGGLAWFMFAIWPLSNPERVPPSRRTWLLSGVASGLAVYGYFVLGFFMPAVVLGVWLAARPGQRWSTLFTWGLGAALGLLPYVLGYLSMAIAVGGWTAMLDLLRQLTTSLAPFSSKLSLQETLQHALSLLDLGLGNGGNEQMIFGQQIGAGPWVQVKLWLFRALPLLLFVLLYMRVRAGQAGNRRGSLILLLLPLSYLAVSCLFGTRLWAHHYSVLTPFLYLMLALLAYHLGRIFCQGWTGQPQKRWQRALVLSLGLGLLAGNLSQQQRFFDTLQISGGTGRMTNALNQLAQDALNQPKDTLYLLPDWGFFMPFAYLTGNRVPFRLETNPQMVQSVPKHYPKLSLAFWQAKDTERFQAELRALGVQDAQLRTYYRLDGAPAFYLLTGTR